MLEFKNIEFAYDNKKVISNFSLILAEGSSCVLYGKSGSGKSTLLNIIAGILTPIKGELLFKSASLVNHSETKLDAYRKENIGIVFQNFHLIKSLTVLENILLAQKLSTGFTDKKAALEALEKLGILAQANSMPANISIGQMQRAAIARAIINRPKILIADEPTSNLDDENARSVISLLLSIAKDTGSTLIIATHDSRIKNLFDHQITIDNGGGNE